ncbi:hypothetical protein JG688_00013746, partial [Phytophthora aleatoria]
LVARVASLVEFERHLKQEELPPIGARVANTKFWAKMRDILFVNRTAVGVEQLDDLATAVIRDDSDAAQAFNGLITRLPPTSLQQTGRASSSHPAFEEMMRDEGLKGRLTPSQLTRKRKTNSPSRPSVSTPRSPPKSMGLLEPKTSVVARQAASTVTLQLPDILNFKTLGYFGTLDQLKETGHRNWLWWVGQPGRNNLDKKYKGPTISDLRVTLHSDKEDYLKKIQSASKPFKLDLGSFQDLPSILAFMDALDPELTNH